MKVDKKPSTLTKEKVIYYKKSQYNQIIVTQKGNLITLRSPYRTKQSQIDTANLIYPCLEYVKNILLSLAFNPFAKSILLIGLGGGSIANALALMFNNAEIAIVEIDKEILYIAKEYFSFKENPQFSIYIEDGAEFIKKHHDKLYDIIILDAYLGVTQPIPLTAKEFYLNASKKMSKDAVLIANLVTSKEKHFSTLISTIGKVFKHLWILDCDRTKNAVVIAGNMQKPLSNFDLSYNACLIKDKLPFNADTEPIEDKVQRPPLSSRLYWRLCRAVQKHIPLIFTLY
ncbi:Spermidine synthase [Candidatus Magnetoovum chiemensis]|nr:Spermidine synthase [Candidatus Magnetoovum chiemensis]